MCRAIWPTAKIACFEPLEHRVSELKELAKHNSGIEVFPCLLGATPAESVPLHVSETASSVLTEHVETNFPVRNYSMRTVDEIVMTHFDGEPPEFMKIDVQGYELEVLKGSEKSLAGIRGILAEINLLDIHQGVPLLAEVIAWLYERDWLAYDICGLTRRPLDRALWQADFVFLPKSSILRADKRWTL
jgi:FkbM family methyltransferase